MQDMQDMIDRLNQSGKRLSKGHRKIAQYIVEHYDKAVFMTASRLGESVGVSESTVVRFAIELGFEGYPQLQRSLQSHIKNRLTTIQRMDVTRSRIGDLDPIEGVLTQDMDKIRRTLEQIDREAFDNAVNTIVDARRIYIQGAMSSGILASFMHYYLRLVFDKVTLIGSVATSEIYQQMIHIGEGDVFIGLSFPRYAKSTINACKFAHDCGSQIIAITDSENSPLAQYAHTTLCATSDMVSFVDSLVAPMSLLNALIVAVSSRNRCRVEQTFRKLETLWDRNDVYKKDV